MDRILIVLREGLGLNFEAMRPALQVGAAVAIGRGGAVIDRVVDGDVFEAQCPAVSPYPGAAAARRPVNPGEQPRPAQEASGELCPLCRANNHPEMECAWFGKEKTLAFVHRLDKHVVEHAAEFNAAPAAALKPSIFDVITGTANLPPQAAQELPSREEHAAQIERVAADLRDDQLRANRVTEALGILDRWVERVEYTDGYVGVVEIEAVEVVVTELKRQQQAIHPVACRYDHWFAGDSEEASFIREHGVCRACADVDEQLTGQVLLKPCSFCGGPPKPIVTHADHPFGAAPRMDNYGDDGLWIEACVFCHECGAQGPALQRDIFDASDYDSALEAAVDLWQNRDERNADLYEASAADGLNFFPRPDMEVA